MSKNKIFKITQKSITYYLYIFFIEINKNIFFLHNLNILLKKDTLKYLFHRNTGKKNC